jgi:rare lipoprotein A
MQRRRLGAIALVCALAMLPVEAVHGGPHHRGITSGHGLVAFINGRLRRFVHPTHKCPFGYRELLATLYWQGARTANGERFHPDGLTVALRSRAFGQHLHIVNPHNGREVTVRHNDYGPATIADMDLSRGAARALGLRQSSYVCARAQ